MRLKNIKCEMCQKGETVGFNKPHSLHRTKRVIKPNLQKYHGKMICTRCLKSLTKTQELTSVSLQNNQSKELHQVLSA